MRVCAQIEAATSALREGGRVLLLLERQDCRGAFALGSDAHRSTSASRVVLGEQKTSADASHLTVQNPIIRKQNAVALSGSPHVSSQPTMPSRTLLADGELQPASSSSLARKPTGHAVPAVLATPTQSPNIDSQSRDTPGALVRPDARQWAGMAEQDKQRWLKEAQREAKEQGKTLVDLR